MIAVVIGIFIMLLLMDLPRMLREEKRRELAAFLVIAAIALVYMLRFAMGKETFSAIKSLSEVTRDIGLNYAIWQGHS